MVLFQLLMNTFFFHFHKLRGVAALGEQVYQPVPSEIDRFKMIQEKIHQAENQEQNNLVVAEEEQQVHQPNEADEGGGGGGDLARHHPFLNHHQQQQQPPPQLQPHLYHHPHPFLSHLLQRLTGAATLHQPTFVMSHPPPPAQSMMQQQQQQQLEPPSPLPPAQHHLEQTIPPSPPSLIAASNQQQHFPVLPQFPQVSPTIHHQLAAAQPHQVGGIVGDPLEGIHSGGQQQHLQLQQSVAGSSLSSAPHLHPETYQTLMQKNLVLPGEVPPSSIDKHHLETMNSGGGGGGGDEHVGMETKGDGKFADDNNPDDEILLQIVISISISTQQKRTETTEGEGTHTVAIAITEEAAAARFWRLVAATPAAGPSPSAPTLTATTTRTSARTTTSGHTRSSRRTVRAAVSSTSSPIQMASFRCGSAVVRLVSFEFDFYFLVSISQLCFPPFPASLPIKGYRCKTHYEFGIRIDRCICNQNWCNLAPSLHRGGAGTFLYLLLPCFSLLLHWLLLNRILL